MYANNGVVAYQRDLATLDGVAFVSKAIVDAWSNILNQMDLTRSPSALAKFFFSSEPMVKILNISSRLILKLLTSMKLNQWDKKIAGTIET